MAQVWLVLLGLLLGLWSGCAFEGHECATARVRIPAPPGCPACVCQPCRCPGDQLPLEMPLPPR